MISALPHVGVEFTTEMLNTFDSTSTQASRKREVEIALWRKFEEAERTELDFRLAVAEAETG